MTRESSFSPQDPEFAYIGMAQQFTGQNYPNNESGLEQARAALEVQHQSTLPPIIDKMQAYELIKEGAVIDMTEQMAALAIRDGDYDAALLTTNHLFFYGDIDFQDSMGGRAFNHSLNLHRALAEKIQIEFGARDQFLRFLQRSVFSDAEQLRRQGSYDRELQILRGFVHMVALDGTLGSEARKRFDPHAVAAFSK